MAPHLRSVPFSEEGPTYVVARSRHVRPGAPYVVAACADDSVADALAHLDHEIHGRAAMDRDGALSGALAAWEAGDHALFHAEERAQRAFRAPAASGRHHHPSVLGKTGGR